MRGGVAARQPLWSYLNQGPARGNRAGLQAAYNRIRSETSGVTPFPRASFPPLLCGSDPEAVPVHRRCAPTRQRNALSKRDSVRPVPETGFDRFGLHSSLRKGLVDAGFQEPRPVQAETIPAAMEGRDILGLARTGTGKTAAFALPILHRRVKQQKKGPVALVVAPTRELAVQIDTEIRMLAKYTRVQTVTVFGGRSVKMQGVALRKNPEVVVGCPGRILDLLQQGMLDLSRIEQLVLDEADHMFDMGFLPDLRRILRALPEERQNLLFSATMPKEIRELADGILCDPHVAELANSAPAEQIEHALCPVAQDEKRDLLQTVLDEPDCRTAIIFTRTKHRARQLAHQLDRKGHRAVALQGNMSQNARDRAMQGFRKGEFDLLVATDIVARGIDVAGVSYVINFDPPSTPETYTHRIGRTGRSEESGRARTFVTREDAEWVRDTEKMLGNAIPRLSFEGFTEEEVEWRAPARQRQQPGRSANRRAGKPAARRGAGTKPEARTRTSASEPRNRTRGRRHADEQEATPNRRTRKTARSDERPSRGGEGRPEKAHAGARRGRPNERTAHADGAKPKNGRSWRRKLTAAGSSDENGSKPAPRGGRRSTPRNRRGAGRNAQPR